MKYPFELENDPGKLADFSFWTGDEYRDLLACRNGSMTEEDFKAKYHKKAAILCLDMTGFTKSTLKHSALYSFFRIIDVHRVCYPIFKKSNADIVHSFADNFTIIFANPSDALDAAFEIHKRVRMFNESEEEIEDNAECCIGIGYGDVYSIGHDKAMGDEMNRASVLGEDTAKGSQTMVTEKVYEAVKERTDCIFSLQKNDEVPFPYYLAQKKEEYSTG